MHSKTMQAVSLTGPGGPEVLHLEQRPIPEPGAGEVLIEVAYAGINRHDCEQRSRGYPPLQATDILGLEVAGRVTAVGVGVTRWRVGDRACALVNGGGYAQYCIAAEPLVLPIPAGLDLAQAASLPETLFTAWLNVFMLGRLAAGEWLLVHGGSSGVGTMAIQLGRLVGAQVLTTAGSAEKCAACVSLGAAEAINYRELDFVEEVRRATAGHGADVILDMVGAEYARRNVDALATGGRLVHVKRGVDVDFCAPFDAIMTKRAIVTGSRLRISPLDLKTEIARQLLERVWPHLGGAVRPVVDSVFPLAQVRAAHAHMESSRHIGKILLAVEGG